MSSHIERRERRVQTFPTSRILAWLFLCVCGGTILVFALQIGSFNALAPPSPSTETPNRSSSADDTQKPEEIVVSDTRFTGFDKLHRPYSITAKSAVQDDNDSKMVHLKGVSAQVRSGSAEDADLRSLKATYHADTKMIDLEGGVEITTKNGLTATMATARVNIKSQELLSEVPTRVTSATATILSNGLQISDDGKRILFFNGVKAIFRGSNRKGNGAQ